MHQFKNAIIAMTFLVALSARGAGTDVKTSTPTSSGPSINDSAGKTSKSNQQGQMLNYVMGAVNFAHAAQCAGSCPHGCCPMAPIYFLMGMQNMAQGGAQGSTAKQAGGTYSQTDTGLNGSGYDPSAVDQIKSDPEVKAGTDFVSTVTSGKAGFTYDPATNSVTTAKGTTIKGSDLNSASSLAAAGVPKAAIDLMASTERDIEAKALSKIAKMGLSTKVVSREESSSGGGGDASFSASGGVGGAGGNGAAGMGHSGLGIDRDPAQVAGMQKNYNGEPIGVAGDSIFKMMTRRYKVKENQSSFFDDAELLMQK